MAGQRLQMRQSAHFKSSRVEVVEVLPRPWLTRCQSPHSHRSLGPLWDMGFYLPSRLPCRFRSPRMSPSHLLQRPSRTTSPPP